MAIHFTMERMRAVMEGAMRWWRGELDRPLLRLVIDDAHPAEEGRNLPVLSQENCTDFSLSPEEIVDGLDAALSRQEYLGDACPMVNFDAFGPGVLAAFCGAKLDNSSGRVWFFPDEEREIRDIHVRYDPNNVYARRIKDIYRAGMARWGGLVIMGLPDLGGVLDVAATFRGSENLLIDLYDEPDEVRRLAGEIQTAWYAAYDDLSAALAGQMGNSNWSCLPCEQPSYIIQCDFCYMISNAMFREFALDTLKEDIRRLDYAIYHLDGKGELIHLDDLLRQEKLAAIQWVPGSGNPTGMHWIDIYRKIEAAGKRSWIVGGPQDFLDLVGAMHNTPYYNCTLHQTDSALAEQLLAAR